MDWIIVWSSNPRSVSESIDDGVVLARPRGAQTAADLGYESVPSFVTDGTISEEFQDRVLDFELKTIGTDKKISRDKVFDFALAKKRQVTKEGEQL